MAKCKTTPFTPTKLVLKAKTVQAASEIPLNYNRERSIFSSIFYLDCSLQSLFFLTLIALVSGITRPYMLWKQRIFITNAGHEPKRL